MVYIVRIVVLYKQYKISHKSNLTISTKLPSGSCLKFDDCWDVIVVLFPCKNSPPSTLNQNDWFLHLTEFTQSKMAANERLNQHNTAQRLKVRSALKNCAQIFLKHDRSGSTSLQRPPGTKHSPEVVDTSSGTHTSFLFETLFHFRNLPKSQKSLKL